MTTALDLLGSPRRRELLRLTWHEERSAGALHRALGDVTFGAVSQHLRKLSDAGLVRCRRAGRFRYYRADPEALGALRAWLEATWDEALGRLTAAAEAHDSPPPENP